jgi:NAD(P)-dependent dehydrogenase (short-subunit alcohol dehydrogenase family)
MADSHRAFLDVAARAMAELGGAAPVGFTGLAPAALAPIALAPAPTVPPPVVAPPPPMAAPAPAPMPAPPPSTIAAAAPTPPRDPARVVIEVVAEKTGYPADMLDLDLEMEAGLGIDSIKQVEILSALQERLPGLPEIAPADLARLRTLRDVAARLSSAALAAAAPAAPAAAAPTAIAAPAPAATARPPVAPAAEPAPLFLATPRLVPAPPAGLAMTGRHAGETVYVTAEARELAEAIARLLRARGAAADVVDRVPDGASAAVCLAGLAPSPGPGSALALHLAALADARAVARHPRAPERLLVTVQSAAGFGLAGDPGAAAWAAGLPGIVKTAAREWPGAAVKAIDVAAALAPEAAAGRIVDELLAGGPELEVVLAEDGRRLAVQLAPEPAEAAGAALALDEGAVVVVTGARGVTAASVEALAAARRLRLVFLGRGALDPQAPSPAPADAGASIAELRTQRAESRAREAAAEIRATLDRLAARGIDALYFTADARDPAAVATALDEARRRLGPIAGIVHGAGVLADRRIEDLTDAQFRDVFSTKVGGLAALLEATRGDPIRAIALFSSISARAGNAGQAAYAAANEVLNKVAAREARARGAQAAAPIVVRSYNWGPWDGGMVDAALRAHFQRRGVALIDRDAGARFFAHDLARARPVELVAAAKATTTAAPAPEVELTLRVDPASDPELADHQIRGRIVVPVVFVLDRALRVAEALRPRADRRARLRDLRVLAGVTLPPGESCRLTVRAAPPRDPGQGGVDALEITFLDDAGRARYRAIADFPAEAPEPPRVPSAGLPTWPLTADAAYRGPLFHGPRFRAIERLEGISPHGGLARLRTAAHLGWAHAPRAVDPALIDGGLQLGLLWAVRERGFPALPQRLGEVRIHRQPAPDEAVRCAFAARPNGAAHIDFDFVYGTLGGEVLAEIRDAEFFAYEG